MNKSRKNKGRDLGLWLKGREIEWHRRLWYSPMPWVSAFQYWAMTCPLAHTRAAMLLPDVKIFSANKKVGGIAPPKVARKAIVT